MNTLTDEECEVVRKMSELPELNMVGCGHGQNYYGIDRENYEEQIEKLNKILIKWCPDLIEFSNFTGGMPNRIRAQVVYGYAPYFVGVHYMPLPSNEPEETE